jgi:ABC-type dipeptide/oligopeptide/nickel transport system permease subunit
MVDYPEEELFTLGDFEVVGPDQAASNTLAREPITYWRDAWRRLRENKVAMVSMVVVILLFILCIIGPHIRGYDYVTMVPGDKNLDSSAEYWWGTDNLGRDQSVLIMIALGNGMGALLVAMCVTSWCGTARQIRGQIIQPEYVLAAEALDVSPLRILTRHFLPNTMGLLILDVATSIPGYIFREAGLSFLGLGLKTPAISLGLLISAGQTVMNSHPNQLLYPALVLSVIVLAFNLFGDGLRDRQKPPAPDSFPRLSRLRSPCGSCLLRPAPAKWYNKSPHPDGCRLRYYGNWYGKTTAVKGGGLLLDRIKKLFRICVIFSGAVQYTNHNR